MERDAYDERIAAIVGDTEGRCWDETRDVFFEYLRANLSLPCEVTGYEDFGWEEFYVFGPGSKEEYERLKKTQPSYKDRYQLLEIVHDAETVWAMFWGEDIGAKVRRICDGKEFLLGGAEIQAVDKKSRNYQLLNDYAVWFVNSR